MAKTSGGVRDRGSSRSKSVRDISRQKTRILQSAARQYGLGTDRFRQIRDNVLSTSKKYSSNIYDNYGGTIPINVYSNNLGLSRDIYARRRK